MAIWSQRLRVRRSRPMVTMCRRKVWSEVGLFTPRSALSTLPSAPSIGANRARAFDTNKSSTLEHDDYSTRATHLCHLGCFWKCDHGVHRNMGNSSSSTAGASIAADPNRPVPQDTKAPFLGIPWIASQINHPDIICTVPDSRIPKSDTEDSLYAEILKDARTIRSCICFYKKPADNADQVDEVSTAMIVGDGMNGHPAILHGGITATMLDETMGMYLAINYNQAHTAKVKLGEAKEESPKDPFAAFTAELKILYLRPVQTPGNMIVTVRTTKKEGRKRWLAAELKQCIEQSGEVVVCATAESLFIAPRPSKL